MNRPILSDTPHLPQPTDAESTAAVPVETEPKPKPQTANIQSTGSRHDVLAGALPEWDLVPLAQFVKRVKRKESS